MNKRHFFGGGFGRGIGIALGFALASALIVYVVKVAYVQPSPQVIEAMDDDNVA